MRAKLFTYTTQNLTKSQKSIVSKRINGYTDKSNRSQYKYERPGLITKMANIKISKNTFIIKETEFSQIENKLKEHGAKVKSWDIVINDL